MRRNTKHARRPARWRTGEAHERPLPRRSAEKQRSREAEKQREAGRSAARHCVEHRWSTRHSESHFSRETGHRCASCTSCAPCPSRASPDDAYPCVPMPARAQPPQGKERQITTIHSAIPFSQFIRSFLSSKTASAASDAADMMDLDGVPRECRAYPRYRGCHGYPRCHGCEGCCGCCRGHSRRGRWAGVAWRGLAWRGMAWHGLHGQNTRERLAVTSGGGWGRVPASRPTGQTGQTGGAPL